MHQGGQLFKFHLKSMQQPLLLKLGITPLLIKADDAATRYMSVPTSISGDIDPETDRTLFYVKGTTTTTLEVLLQRKP